MPPRRGLKLFNFDFYKDVAPTALVAGFREANSLVSPKPGEGGLAEPTCRVEVRRKREENEGWCPKLLDSVWKWAC
jgi:hypothetical protein